MADKSALRLPKLGLTMTEAQIAAWHVAEGDEVKDGDLIYTIETEKVASEVTARGGGRMLSLVVPVGETIEVGEVVAYWTGPPTMADVDDETQTSATDAKMSVDKTIEVNPAGGRSCQTEKSLNDSAPIALQGIRRPATAIERLVARRLTLSKQEIPHFYVFDSANVSPLISYRESYNRTRKAGEKLSVNHCMIAAVIRAIAAAPQINAIWQNDEVVMLRSISIGIAVDSDHGVVVPVLHDVGNFNLDQIIEAAGDLVAAARSGPLSAAQQAGGAISISNVGMYGVAALVPIINPGQACMLGVGGLQDAFRPDANGKPTHFRSIHLALSCDHRILDGVRAAKFLRSIREHLETPDLLSPIKESSR